MSKWYEVSVTSVKVYVIEVDDDFDEDGVYDEVATTSTDDFSSMVEVDTKLLKPYEIDCAKRHADEVIEL